MKFPSLVYISPGPHQIGANTYGYLQVNDFDELEAAVKKGYYPTPVIAVEKPANFDWERHAKENGWIDDSEPEPSEPVTSVDSDNAPPNRAELEAKAKELNIKFNGNTKDETLAEKIAQSIGESQGD